MTPLRHRMLADMQIRNLSPHTQTTYVRQVALFARQFGKSPAALGRDHDPYAWRLWSFAYTPKKTGRATLLARATDSKGSVQPKDAVWNQSGYLHNGWQSVDIEVGG